MLGTTSKRTSRTRQTIAICIAQWCRAEENAERRRRSPAKRRAPVQEEGRQGGSGQLESQPVDEGVLGRGRVWIATAGLARTTKQHGQRDEQDQERKGSAHRGNRRDEHADVSRSVPAVPSPPANSPIFPSDPSSDGQSLHAACPAGRVCANPFETHAKSSPHRSHLPDRDFNRH